MRRPTICVTLSGCTVDEMLADAARATAVGADLCEVRLDKLWVEEKFSEPQSDSDSKEEKDPRRTTYSPPEYIPKPFDSVDLSQALDAFKGGIDLPVVLTCRPERQGGHFPGTEEERISVLRAAIDSGVSWIDLESDIDSKTRTELRKIASGKTNVISSTHFQDEPSSASEIISDIEEMSDPNFIILFCSSMIILSLMVIPSACICRKIPSLYFSKISTLVISFIVLSGCWILSSNKAHNVSNVEFIFSL